MLDEIDDERHSTSKEDVRESYPEDKEECDDEKEFTDGNDSSNSNDDKNEVDSPSHRKQAGGTMSMNQWFQRATLEECDTMSALQLDYRFKGDNMIKWWQILQQVGFTYSSDQTYHAPQPEPSTAGSRFFRTRIFDSNELFEFLDKYAIPQLSSTLQDIPPTDTLPDELANMTKTELNWWRQLRDDIIFRKFHHDLQPSDISEHHSSTKTTKRCSDARTTTNANGANNGNHTDNNPSRRTLRNRTNVEPNSTSSRRSVTASEPGAELYFQKPKPTKESTETRISNNSMYQDEQCDVLFPTMQEYAKARSSYSFVDVEAREAAYAEEHFDEWNFLLATNHSLLLYGLGSKRTILNQFANNVLAKDGDLVVLDGFDKDISIQGILDLIIDYCLDGKRPPPFNVAALASNTRLLEHSFKRVGITGPHQGDHETVPLAIGLSRALSRKIESQPSELRRPLNLVIHTVDGVGLRSHSAQEALAALVYHSLLENGTNAVRLIASIDHVNAPAVLWNSWTKASFKWMWKQVHTYRPYIEETAESNFVDVATSRSNRRGKRTASDGDGIGNRHGFATAHGGEETAIFSVLQSLSPRHTEALKLLAELQISVITADTINRQRDGGNDDGMKTRRGGKKRKLGDIENEVWVDYIDLMRQCQLKCVATDQALRNFLKELCDQDIVEKRQNTSSTVRLFYRIPHSKDKLEEIIEYQH